MFGLTQAKVFGGLIAVIFIGAVVTAGYMYVTNLQTKVENLTTENTGLKISNKSFKETLKTIKEDLAKAEEARNELHDDLNKAREKMGRMSKLFADHNFTKLANKKPGLIQLRINKATKKILKEMEEASQ